MPSSAVPLARRKELPPKRRGLWSRLTFYSYLILFLLAGTLLPLFIIFNDPNSPHRAAVAYFIDEICGGTPSNSDPRGIFPNIPEPGPTWRIAVYDGARKHRLFFGLGGDDFREAACQSYYTHRINAPDSVTAASLLRKLLAERPAQTQVEEIAIIDHGRAAVPEFAQQRIQPVFYDTIAEFQPAEVTIRFYGCCVGAGTEGKKFLSQLAADYGFRAVASKAPVKWNTFRLFGGKVIDVPQEDWVVVGGPPK